MPIIEAIGKGAAGAVGAWAFGAGLAFLKKGFLGGQICTVSRA